MATKTKKAPKAKPKKTVSQIKKKAAPAPNKGLKLVTSPKAKKAAPVNEERHPFWKLVEMKEHMRKQHEEAQQGEHSFKKHVEYRHQAKFARFNGPRRRAA